MTDASMRVPRERVAGWTPAEPLRYPDIVALPPRPRAGFDDHPVWLVALVLLIPVARGELHFYLIHRLIRWFGSFHDGSPEADETFRARRAARCSPAAQATTSPR